MSLLANHGLLGGGIVFDSSYQAVLDRAGVLGYTDPSSSIQSAQNDFVVNLKALGIWSFLDILYVTTSGSKEFAKLNWKAPSSFEGTLINTPTWSEGVGFTGNTGTGAKVSTGWNPSTNGVNYTRNNAGILYDVSSVGSYSFPGGVRYDMTDQHLGGNSHLHYMNDSGGGMSGVGAFPGFTHKYRTASNSTRFYKNGSQLFTGSSASNVLFNGTVHFCGTQLDGATITCRLYACGAAMNGSESGIYTAWTTYKTAIGI